MFRNRPIYPGLCGEKNGISQNIFIRSDARTVTGSLTFSGLEGLSETVELKLIHFTIELTEAQGDKMSHTAEPRQEKLVSVKSSMFMFNQLFYYC